MPALATRMSMPPELLDCACHGGLEIGAGPHVAFGEQETAVELFNLRCRLLEIVRGAESSYGTVSIESADVDADDVSSRLRQGERVGAALPAPRARDECHPTSQIGHICPAFMSTARPNACDAARLASDVPQASGRQHAKRALA